MKKLFAAVIFGLIAGMANAGIIRVESPYSVDETLDRLEKVVSAAGAKVFARVEHARGAEKIGMKLAPEALLIFGKPELGTPAMQANPLAGLVLPARVLAYEDEAGKVWLAYEDPAAMLAPYDIPADAEVVQKLTKALKGVTGKAVAK